MTIFDTVARGVAYLESVVKGCGGPSKDWYVGISHDAIGRLAEHGMTKNPFVGWAEFTDGEIARSVEEYFLATGMQGDMGGGIEEKPPTQVYVFRQPRV